jgi:hypothetical protein
LIHAPRAGVDVLSGARNYRASLYAFQCVGLCWTGHAQADVLVIDLIPESAYGSISVQCIFVISEMKKARMYMRHLFISCDSPREKSLEAIRQSMIDVSLIRPERGFHFCCTAIVALQLCKYYHISVIQFLLMMHLLNLS